MKLLLANKKMIILYFQNLAPAVAEAPKETEAGKILDLRIGGSLV